MSDKKNTAPGGVLAADDDKAIRALLRFHFDQSGTLATIVPDGKQTIEQFKAKQWQIVLLDYEMPDMTGEETCRLLRRMEQNSGQPPTPIVLMTAHDVDENLYSPSLFSGTLHKPFTEKSLAAAVHGEYSSLRNERQSVTELPKELYPLLPALQESIQTAVDNVRRDLGTGDFGAAQTHAHTIKGAAATFGLEKISALALQLEKACETNDSAVAESLLQQLEGAAAMVVV